MKQTLTAVAAALLVCFAAWGSTRATTCQLKLKLVDAETGATLPGVIRLTDKQGQPISARSVDTQGNVTELMSRGLGLKDQPEIDRWSVVTGEVTLQLPRAAVTVEAFSGLETELSKQAIDLSNKDSLQAAIPLTRFYDANRKGMRSANTHLHLMKLTREQSDRYLLDVPRADRLDALFVSYLERAEADREYITNQYSRADFDKLSATCGVVIGNGEEHRHNFTAQGEGYGHVMLLDVPKLVLPVSIGPGITKTGTDGLPIQRGIDQARRDKATAIWCHNNWGMERLANLVTGRLDAQNIFDGGAHGSFKDSFYRALNAGVKLPFSAGTDWFMYDFSRTYVKLVGPLTTNSWLQSLAAGRSYITNGTFLEFQVLGREPGDTITLAQPGLVTIVARGIGRVDFQRLEVIQNGAVVKLQTTKPEGGHFVADLKFDLPLEGPCWLALRIPPPPVKDDPKLQETVPLHEYGQPLFAHTSAVYVNVAGKSYFDPKVAAELLQEMKDTLPKLRQQAQFADAAEHARVVDVYQDAISKFEQRLKNRD